MPKVVKEQGENNNNNDIQEGPKSDQLLQSEDPSSGIPVEAADVEIQLPAALRAVFWKTNLLRSRQLIADKSRG